MAAKRTKKTAARSSRTKQLESTAKTKKAARPARHPDTAINVIKGAETGPGGGTIILENDHVRIWDIALEPGHRSALHTHLHDYMLVQIEGDEICTEPHEDTQGEYNRRMVLETRPGDTCYIQKGGTETAVNTGKKPWREICIELK